MAYTDDEKVQEWFLLLGDKLAPVKKIWWYILLITFVFAVPAYYVIKTIFVTALVAGYKGPAIIYTAPIKEPLQVLDKQIFSYPGNFYSGYVKIKNVNLEWGVGSQEYQAEFRTFGGTVVNSIDATTFILPGKEKLIVLPRFTSDKKPDEISITFGKTEFVHDPGLSVPSEVQRTSLQVTQSGTTVASAYVNNSAFTIRKVDVTIALFNTKNEIVVVNYTNINDVLASETRTLTFSWPDPIPSAVRSEVYAEVNVFDQNILTVPAGVSPFDSNSQ